MNTNGKAKNAKVHRVMEEHIRKKRVNRHTTDVAIKILTDIIAKCCHILQPYINKKKTFQIRQKKPIITFTKRGYISAA